MLINPPISPTATDAVLPPSFNVTEEDILLGVRRDARNCPIARAFKRSLIALNGLAHPPFVAAMRRAIQVQFEQEDYRDPQPHPPVTVAINSTVSKWALHFDQDQPVQPITVRRSECDTFYQIDDQP